SRLSQSLAYGFFQADAWRPARFTPDLGSIVPAVLQGASQLMRGQPRIAHRNDRSKNLRKGRGDGQRPAPGEMRVRGIGPPLELVVWAERQRVVIEHVVLSKAGAGGGSHLHRVDQVLDVVERYPILRLAKNNIGGPQPKRKQPGGQLASRTKDD